MLFCYFLWSTTFLRKFPTDYKMDVTGLPNSGAPNEFQLRSTYKINNLFGVPKNDPDDPERVLDTSSSRSYTFGDFTFWMLHLRDVSPSGRFTCRMFHLREVTPLDFSPLAVFRNLEGVILQSCNVPKMWFPEGERSEGVTFEGVIFRR